MPRLLVHTPYRSIDIGAYIQIRPEPHRPGDPAPEIPVGTELTINRSVAVVRAASRTEVVLETDGHLWRLTPLKPTEMRHHRAHWEPGTGTTEWVVRGRAGEDENNSHGRLDRG